MNKTNIRELQRLLDFCIYELYEKKDKNFDWKFYLEYISKKLKDLSLNKLTDEI